jgi:hypothetical protein
LRDSKHIAAFLEQLDPRERGTVIDEAMRDLSKLIKANARTVQIITGRGEDPVVAPPLSDRLTYRTGHLTRSIDTDFSDAPRRYVIGTPLGYGVVHELGLAPFPKRAFLQPAGETIIETEAEPAFRRAITRARARA